LGKVSNKIINSNLGGFCESIWSNQNITDRNGRAQNHELGLESSLQVKSNPKQSSLKINKRNKNSSITGSWKYCQIWSLLRRQRKCLYFIGHLSQSIAIWFSQTS